MYFELRQVSAAIFRRIVRNRREAVRRSALVVGLVLTFVAPASGFFSTSGAIDGSEPVQSGRPSRDLVPDTCEASDFDGSSGGFGIVFRYDLYAFVNRTESDLCIRAQIDLQPGCVLDALHSAAYVPSFAPTSIGSGFVGSADAGVWSFRVPARSPFELNVHETVAGGGCTGYSLSLDADRHFNLVAPRISGTPAVGGSVAADAGTWAGANREGPPTAFAYQWRRCNAAGAGCANTGVTGAGYQVGTGDVGSTLQVLVTAGAAGGTQNVAASAPTSPVASVTPGAAPPAAPPPPPLAPPAAQPARAAHATFTNSPRSLRVSRSGRFSYSFAASPGRAGTARLTSTRPVRIGRSTRKLRLGPKAFTAPATGDVRLAFRLPTRYFQALKRRPSLQFVVSVTVGTTTFRTRLTLKPPASAGASSRAHR